MAMIARQCPQHRVTVVDINAERIAQWNSDNLPIYEPGLDEIVKAVRGSNLFFSTDVPPAIREADIIFVCVNTPTKTFGAGAGMAADLQYWERTARQILEHSEVHKIIVEKSTLPVRTAQAMERILDAADGKRIRFEVLSNPEFLAEGTAIARPRASRPGPDRLPGDRSGAWPRATSSSAIYAHWVPARPDHHHQPLERRALQARRQRLPGPAHLLDQHHLGPLREDRGRRRRGGPRRRHRLADRPQLPQRLRRASAAPASRRTSSTSSISAATTACTRWPTTGSRSSGSTSTSRALRQRKMLGGDVQHRGRTSKIALFGFAFKADTGDTRESPGHPA